MIDRRFSSLSGGLLAAVLSCFLLSVSFVSCSSDKASETAQPTTPGAAQSYALTFTPKQPVRNSVVTLIPAGFDLSDAQVLWLVDGEPVATPEPEQLNAGDMFEIKKGVTIQAKAVVHGQEVLSEEITITNAPPELTGVRLLPGATLSVEALGNDLDGDPVTLQYAWTRNGAPAGTGKTIEGPVKRGDRISVRVTPYDGERHGQHADLERTIKNMPPMIAENRKFSFNGSQYTYQTTASDPDGDSLKYSLGSAPAGMTIDSGSGLVQWTVPKEFTGKATAAINVDDGNGGVANYVVNITITSTKVK